MEEGVSRKRNATSYQEPNFSPGDLVKIVDICAEGNVKFKSEDDRNQVTEICGHIGIVLSSDTFSGTVVEIGKKRKTFRGNLALIARYVYGESRARVMEYASAKHVSAGLIKEMLTTLENSMQDLPKTYTDCSSPARYAPGDTVRVSKDIEEVVQRKKVNDSLESLHLSGNGFIKIDCLLTPGRVVHVNRHGDVIVEFSCGRVWCIHSSCLQPIESEEACEKSAEHWSPEKLSKDAECMIGKMLKSEKTAEALHAACFFGIWDAVKFLLDERVDLHSEDKNGNNSLHYAAHGNQPDMIKFLLGRGVSINATNKYNHTALHFAVKGGFVDCVRKLTEKGNELDADAKDDEGNTALHVAFAMMATDIVHELMKLQEMDFTKSIKDGLNYLHLGAIKGSLIAAENALSKGNALVDIQEEKQGNAALHFAAAYGHYCFVETLLSQGSCSVDLPNKNGDTPLLLATREGRCGIVELLLLAGADINKTNRNGDTALHISLKKVSEKTSERLDISSTNEMKKVAEKMRAAFPHEADDRLLLACFLAARGANTRCLNSEGKSPLIIAKTLEEPAFHLIAYFAKRMRCLQEGCEKQGNNLFAPSLSCEKCGRQVTRCLSCQAVIVKPASTEESIHTPESVIKTDQPKLGPELYRMAMTPRGMCIIFNNVSFQGRLKKRTGSEGDAQRLACLFRQLNFRVNVEKDLNAGDILYELLQAKKAQKKEKPDCLVVVFMSHGANDVIAGSDGEALHLRDGAYILFNDHNCCALRGKPKLFIIQACRTQRGNNAPAPIIADVAPPDNADVWKDMYLAYATIPNTKSKRNTTDGSWFLSAICSIFSQHAATMHLEDLMEKVKYKVKDRSADKENPQTVDIVLWGWVKLLYFNPGF
ncbi:uncharacterized protein LOC144147095 isoform X2 [Haemaphysalis longicornis]